MTEITGRDYFSQPESAEQVQPAIQSTVVPPPLPPQPPPAVAANQPQKWYQKIGITGLLRIQRGEELYYRVEFNNGESKELTPAQIRSHSKFELAVVLATKIDLPKMPAAKNWHSALEELFLIVVDADLTDELSETKDENYFSLMDGFLSGEIAIARDIASRKAALAEMRSGGTKNAVFIAATNMVVVQLEKFAAFLASKVDLKAPEAEVLAIKVLKRYFERSREPGSGRRHWQAPLAALTEKGFELNIDPDSVS